MAEWYNLLPEKYIKLTVGTDEGLSQKFLSLPERIAKHSFERLGKVRNCIPFGLHRFPNAGGSLDDLKQREARIRRKEGSSGARRRSIVEVMYVQFSLTKGRKWLSAMQRSRRSYECKTSVKQTFCRYDWNVSLRNDSLRKWVLTRVKTRRLVYEKALKGL